MEKKDNVPSIELKIRLRGKEIDIFNEFFQHYQIETGGVQVRANAIGRYIILEYIRSHGGDLKLPTSESVREFTESYRLKSR